MTSPTLARRTGFTLMETVIAIGVLAVLLTTFMYVFGPAVAGIRKSINTQEADRLASTLEHELGTLRDGQGGPTIKTGFDKGFDWIKSSHDADNALCVYQYRGDPAKLRADGTLAPVTITSGKAGSDFVMQPMMRRASDKLFLEDLEAVEGPVFAVKCTQLVYDNSTGLILGSPGQIKDPVNGRPATTTEDFTEAVIAFTAEFYSMPANTPKFFSGDAFKKRFKGSAKPIFSRNLAVRR